MPAILAGISFLRLDSQASRDNSMRSDPPYEPSEFLFCITLTNKPQPTGYAAEFA
jgi:hypothetical protein